jgi:5-methyltetrahydrofolate--homocysteine methyltransferase
MKTEEFQALTQNVILLDGATGSNLMAAGMPRGVCTEKWVLDHKDVILDLQKKYVDAGSRIIYAPTFGGNRVNLTKHNLQDRIEEINHTLVGFAREAAGSSAYVAGDITTTGEMMEPFGDMTPEQAFETYREQVKYLCEAGVDLIVAETMISIDETLAAIDAIHDVCDLPVLCTVTVDANGNMFTGGNAVKAAVAFEKAGAAAVGINCSVGPEQLVSVVRNIKENVKVPVIAKPNAGMPTVDRHGNAIYTMQPEEFAKHLKVLVDTGASIVGGCCGTTPEFIRAAGKILSDSYM